MPLFSAHEARALSTAGDARGATHAMNEGERFQLLNGELEAAVTTAGLAVDGGDALQPSRFQHYVTDFQREVSAHPTNPAVQEFNDKVQDAVTELDD
jgi:hypothetical protein